MLSAPIVIVEPSEPLVTLREVRRYLRVDEGGLDTELEGYIASAIWQIEQITSNRLATQTVELLADRFADLHHLTVGPVQSIAAIRYIASDGTVVEMASSDYELFGAHLERGIRPSIGRYWPVIRAVQCAITVRLVVGHIVLPGHLKRAVLDAVRQQFDGTPVDLYTATINDRIGL